MKHLNQFITEYIIKNKLDKPIDSEDHYKYFPKTKEELKKNIKECLDSKNYNLNCIDTSKITDMSSLFYDTKLKDAIEKIDISKWDVSNVTNMKYMFYECINFTGKGLEKWNVCKVESMFDMFYACEKFTGESIENWNVSNVTNMYYMFGDCYKLNCDLSKWDVSNVKDMSHMFYGCKIFEGKGLENWDVSNVENMSYMFCNCYNFNCDLSNWKINKCEDFNRIFANCKNFNFEYVESWGKNIKTWANKDNMFYGMKNKPSWYEE